MFSNATVTITRRGETIDADTGYREAGDGEEVLTAARCVFSQNKSAGRQVNANGMREYTKPVYALLIPGYPDADLRPGDQATVTPDAGPVQDLTLNDAVFTVGISESHWECDVDRIKTPD